MDLKTNYLKLKPAKKTTIKRRYFERFGRSQSTFYNKINNLVRIDKLENEFFNEYLLQAS